jgi:hypothetical protein
VQDELVVRRADPALRRHVSRYCGYAHRTPGPGRQREPLSTGVVLIFGLGPRLGVTDRILTAVQTEPGACAELWWGQRLSAVSVDLRGARAKLVADLLNDAWETKAPKRLTRDRVAKRPV